MGFAFLVDEGVGVNARAIHVAVVGRDADIVEEEGEHVQALRVVGEEVNDPPVLLDVGFGIRFEGMNHVGELHPVTDEEYGEVVPNKIKVSLRSVILCKSSSKYKFNDKSHESSITQQRELVQHTPN